MSGSKRSYPCKIDAAYFAPRAAQTLRETETTDSSDELFQPDFVNSVHFHEKIHAITFHSLEELSRCTAPGICT